MMLRDASAVRRYVEVGQGQYRSQHPDQGRQCGQVVPVIKFLVEAGFRVMENVINWVKVRNPESQALCEQSVKMPNSLLVQSRAVIWRLLRDASISNQMKYGERIEKLVQSEELPLIMSDYLQCKL